MKQDSFGGDTGTELWEEFRDCCVCELVKMFCVSVYDEVFEILWICMMNCELSLYFWYGGEKMLVDIHGHEKILQYTLGIYLF